MAMPTNAMPTNAMPTGATSTQAMATGATPTGAIKLKRLWRGGAVGLLLALAAFGGWLRWGRDEERSYAAERVPISATAVPPTSVGMNLGPMVYWSQEFPFADPIKGSTLTALSPDRKWLDPADVLTVDAGGHPLRVPTGTRLAVTIKSGGGDRTQAGTYDCRVSPGWQVKASRAATIAPGSGGFVMTVAPPPALTGLRLYLTATQDGASLGELACRPRGVPAGATFNPVFLRDLKPFGVIRFMDWMKTNNQPPQTWAGRTTPASFSQSNKNGVSVEVMVELANTLGADPWFTLPLEADDAYYRNFATYVRDHLAPGRKAYVEVSNEVWNGGFQQSKRATLAGQQLYPQASPKDANSMFYADRVSAVMRVWEDVYKGQPQRIVRVMATLVGNATRPPVILAHGDTAKHVDAMAVAPYFGPMRGDVPQTETDITTFTLAHGPDYVDAIMKRALVSKAQAARFGLPLITYEGGPAYVDRRPRLDASLERAEMDPRMYDVYTAFLTRWRTEVGGLFMPYDFVNQRWGHQRYTGQPLAEAPKMRALVDFIDHNQTGRGTRPH